MHKKKEISKESKTLKEKKEGDNKEKQEAQKIEREDIDQNSQSVDIEEQSKNTETRKIMR